MSAPEVGIEVDESEPVMVLDINYLAKVMDLIDVTPKRSRFFDSPFIGNRQALLVDMFPHFLKFH